MPIVGTPVTSTPTPGNTDPGVIATPVEPTVAPVACETQDVLEPRISQFYKKFVLSRLRSIQIQSGQTAEIIWTVIDRDGNPVDLTSCGFTSESSASSASLSSSESLSDAAPSVKLRVAEKLSIGRCHDNDQVHIGHVVAAADGRVKFTLDKLNTKYPGIFFGEVGVLDGDGNLRFANTFYLIINRGLNGKRQAGGPPTLAEIRLHLRDSTPEESLLLDNIKFDDAEIALAITRPVEYWNEIPPDVKQYTTSTFPFRYFWLEAICGNLFLMLAEQYRANNLSYAASGIQVDDQNKEPNYERAAQTRLTEWRDFVRRKKAEINLDNCYGGIGSTYGLSRTRY